MKIYFGSAITQGRKYLRQSQLIVDSIKELGHQVISEYVVDPNLKIGLGLTPEKLFERETKQIEKADLMVAEVTVPSWGTSFLMSHALKHNKPVLAFFYKKTIRKLSMMVRGHPDLYVEHYNEDNIKSLLDHYLRFFKRLKKKKGKLIVVDGTDGSGKTTQAKLLVKDLKKQGLKVKSIEFPRYYASFHGHLVNRFLQGEFGKPQEINPYLISLAYALDRLTARKQMREWLEAGYIVVANRYTTSSLAHQSARLPEEKREEFLAWLDEMEYKKHKIPREDLVIFLQVPVAVSQKLLKKRGGEDLAEEDKEHQKEALKMYLYLSEKFKHWEKIDCLTKDGKMKTREKIHQEVMEVLKKRGII